jgi:hypothetical protein
LVSADHFDRDRGNDAPEQSKIRSTIKTLSEDPAAAGPVFARNQRRRRHEQGTQSRIPKII